MLKFIAEGTIKDGSKYSLYFDIDLNESYIIINGHIYMRKGSLSIAQLQNYIQRAFVIADSGLLPYLVIPMRDDGITVKYYLESFSDYEYLQQSAVKCVEYYSSKYVKIAINDQTFKLVNGTYYIIEAYFYTIRNNRLLGFTPMDNNILKQTIEYELILPPINNVLDTKVFDTKVPDTKVLLSTKVLDTKEITTPYSSFLGQFKEFEAQTIKQAAIVDYTKMQNVLTAIKTISDNIVFLEEFYNKK